MTKRVYRDISATVGSNGWSEWQTPIATAYRMACCDCGLVHEMEFRVGEEGGVQFRLRRDNRATGGIRQSKRKALMNLGWPASGAAGLWKLLRNI